MTNADIDYIEAEVRLMRGKTSPWPPLSGHALNAYTRLESLRTATPPPPSDPSLIFSDDFVGVAGAVPDPMRWCVIGGGNNLNGCPRDYSNVFLDGNGHLVVRAKRAGTAYSGGFVGTFNYQGWPPSVVKASFSLPFKVEMSALMPATPGAHASLWAMNVDRPNSQKIFEIDIAEERLSMPTVAGSHIHTWLSGKQPVPPVDAMAAVTDMSKNWHTYAAEVYPDHVTTFVDGVQVGKFYGVSGTFGLLLDNGIDPAGSWGADGAQPAPADSGPWDMLVDYLRVWRLA